MGEQDETAPPYTAHPELTETWSRMEAARDLAIHAAGLCYRAPWRCPHCPPDVG